MAIAEAKREAQDSNLILHQRTREFIKLYERNAYRVFNLALRISGERAAAARASERAFIGQLSEAEPRLTQAVVIAALAEASKSGAGKGEEGTLAAVATLPPPQRAALALKALDGAGPAEIAEAMSIGADAAGRLLNEAVAGLAAKLDVSAEEAERACEDWPWVDPPAEIWSSVYPRVHAGLKREAEPGAGKRHLKAVQAAAPAAGAAQTSAPAGEERKRRSPIALPLGALKVLVFAVPMLLFGILRLLRGLRRRPRLAMVAAGVLALAVFAYAQLGGGTESDEASAPVFGAIPGAPGSGGEGSAGDSGSEGGGSVHKPLTPEELDKLRLQELEQLKAYEKKQANKRLSAAQREAAAIEANRLILTARRRQVLAERRALRARLQAQRLRAQRDLARQRAQERRGGSRESGEQRVVIDDGRAPKSPTKKPTSKTPAPTPAPGPPQTREEAEAKCLYNADAGTFICPE